MTTTDAGLAPDTYAVLTVDIDTAGRPQLAKVVDHVAADLTPPEDGLILVQWSRNTISWEYPEDLSPVTGDVYVAEDGTYRLS